MASQPGGARAGREVFPGPRPFQRDEGDLFFGRTREAQDLFDLALSYRVLLLYSRSGAGKTSLVNASLLQRLQGTGFTTMVARVAGNGPSQPELADAPGFNIFTFNALSTLLRDRIDVGRAAADTLAQHFGQAAAGTPQYLVFDQFEELFTLHPERWADREGFFAQLSQALKENPDLSVLISMREDFVASLDPYGDHVPGGFRFRYRLERLRKDAALQAIVQPLERAGFTFESIELAEGLVRDLSVERVWLKGASTNVVGEFVEPMHLQVVCRNLIAALPAGQTVLTSGHVSAHAKVNEALANYYQAAIRRAAAQYHRTVDAVSRLRTAVARRRGFQARLRRWIDRELITGSGTRAFAFAGDATAAGIPASAVESLARERVVHVEQRAGADWIELSHDRFVEPIRAANEAWRGPRRTRLALSVGTLILILLFGAGMWLIRQQRAVAVQAALAAEESKRLETERRLAQVRVERDAAADITKGYQNALTPRLDAWGAVPTDKPLTPQDLDMRLDAAGYLERMNVRQECAGVSVVFYVRSAPHPDSKTKLVDIWKGLGLTVTEDDQRGIPQTMNAIWYGNDVRPACWRAVACTLIRAGIPLKQVGQPANDPEGKRRTIEVGYSGPARNNQSLTAKQLWTY